jgi:hypothetical protein
MATALSPHFTLAELNPHHNALTSAELANLRQLAALLERLRAAVGVPLTVDSGHRTPAQNRVAGGVATSAHLTGKAADVVPVGLSRAEAARRVKAAAKGGQLGPFGELIVYPSTTGHVHITLPLGGAQDGQVLERLAEGGYRELFRVAITKLTNAARAVGSSPAALALLVLAALAFFSTWRERA